MFNQFCKRLRVVLELEQIGSGDLRRLLGDEYCDLNGDYPIPADITMRLFKHPRLQKYAMHIMTNQCAPLAGQISPDLAHCGQTATTC